MDLQSVVKKQIFQLVDSVQPKSGYKTVIIDDVVDKIFSFCLKTHELLDRKVANVVFLDKARKTEDYLDGVYICQASAYNIGCIAADYTVMPHRYNGAHVFFLPGATNNDIMRLKNSVAGKFVETLDVAKFFVFPLERSVFSFGDLYINDKLYNANSNLQVKTLDLLAHQILNLVEGLGDNPAVRYLSSPAPYADQSLPRMLAEKVSANLDKLQGSGDPADAEKRQRSTLLIVDRSIDIASPLLHEFTYQAMAYDLLKFDDRNIFKSADGKTTGKVEEDDVDWVELRHLHISRVTEALSAKLADLKKNNPHFADTSTDAKVSDIRNMMAALPDFVKSKDRVALNLEIATECMNSFESLFLSQLGPVEQAAMLGPDPEAEDLSVSDELIGLLARDDITRPNKLRLLMIYVLGRRSGLYEADYDRLRRHAGFDELEINMIENLAVFGAVTKKRPEQSSTSKPKGPPVLFSENTREQLLFARYTPGLKNVVEKLITGTLDTNTFPYVGSRSLDDDLINGQTAFRSQRQRATWATSNAKQPSRPRVIVFVLGGMTPGEMRSAYELSQEHPRDVIIGGDDVITANKFLAFLSRQRLPRNQLRLPIDRAPKEPPAVLFQSDRQNKAKVDAQKQQQSQQPPPLQKNDSVLPSNGAPQTAIPGKPEKQRKFFGFKRK